MHEQKRKQGSTKQELDRIPVYGYARLALPLILLMLVLLTIPLGHAATATSYCSNAIVDIGQYQSCNGIYAGSYTGPSTYNFSIVASNSPIFSFMVYGCDSCQPLAAADIGWPAFFANPNSIRLTEGTEFTVTFNAVGGLNYYTPTFTSSQRNALITQWNDNGTLAGLAIGGFSQSSASITALLANTVEQADLISNAVNAVTTGKALNNLPYNVISIDFEGCNTAYTTGANGILLTTFVKNLYSNMIAANPNSYIDVYGAPCDNYTSSTNINWNALVPYVTYFDITATTSFSNLYNYNAGKGIPFSKLRDSWDLGDGPGDGVQTFATYMTQVPQDIANGIGISVFNTNVLLTGGNYVAINAITSNILLLTKVNHNVLQTNSLTSNTYSFLVTSGDSSSERVNLRIVASGNTLSATSATFQVNPTLTDSWTASNAITDYNQYQLLTASLSGGTSPYTYNFLVYNSLGTLVANFLSPTATSATSNTFFFQISPTWLTGTYTANIIITDSASSPYVSSNTLEFTVDTALNANPPTPTLAQIDNGQSVVLTSNPSGGDSPYTYLWHSGISGSCASDTTPLGTGSTQSVSPTSNTFYCYTVTDSATFPAVATSTGPSNVVVYTPLAVPSLSASPAPPFTDQTGNTIVFTSSWSGGVPNAFTANYQIYNTITKALVANALYTNIAGTSNTFSYLIPSSLIGNTIAANVFITDNSYTPQTTNSVPTGTFTIVSGSGSLTSTSWTVSNNPVAFSQPQLFSAAITGGTSPYSYQYSIYNSLGLCYTNTYSSVSSLSNTFRVTTNTLCGTGTMTANLLITDANSNTASNTLNFALNSNTFYIDTTNSIASSPPVLSDEITISTSSTNEVLILYGSMPQGGGTLSVSDSAGLNWQRRAIINPIGSTEGNFVEYYATSIGQLTNDQITLTTSELTYMAFSVFSIIGANIQQPFDTNPTIPNTITTSNNWLNLTSNTFSTNSNDMILYMVGGGGGVITGQANAIGIFTPILTLAEVKAEDAAWALGEYQIATPQSSITATLSWSLWPVQAGGIVDAIMQAGTYVAPSSPTLTILPNLPTTLDVGQQAILTGSLSGGTPPYTFNYIVFNSITNSIITNQLYTGVASTSNTFTWTIPSSILGNTVGFNVIMTDATTNMINSTRIKTLTINQQLTIPVFSASNAVIPIGGMQSITASVSGGTSPYDFNIIVSAPNGVVLFHSLTGFSSATSNTLAFTQIGPLGTWTANVFIIDSAAIDPIASASFTYLVSNGVNPNSTVYLRNATANPAWSFNSIITGPACSANTLQGSCVGNDLVTGTQSLKSDLYVYGNFMLASGSVLTTNGYVIVLPPSGIFNALGANVLAGNTVSMVNLPNSYGGSGGGGGSNAAPTGQSGGNTLALGGSGGTTDAAGSNGKSPAAPSLSSSLIFSWTENGVNASQMQQYMSGGFGGASGGREPSTYGSYGIYIQAGTIIGGTYNALGQQGLGGGGGGDGSGGGGGGLIILAYSSSISQVSNIVSGGGGGVATYGGGGGGTGNFLEFHYTTMPIPMVIVQRYPINIYTINSNDIISYILTQAYNNILTTLQSNVLSLNYTPPANQMAGLYEYNAIKVINGVNTIIPVNISINMTDIAGPLTFNSPIIQYFPNFAYCPTWAVVPSSWQIKSDLPANQRSNQSNPCGTVFSNANLTFTPQVQLTYNGIPFTFIANAINNPLIGQITQQSFTTNLANVINPSSRTIANLSVFSQGNFNSLATSMSIVGNFTFNNYKFSKSANATGNSLYYVEIPEGNYINPPISFILNDSATTPLFYQHTDTFCPVYNQPNGIMKGYTLGLVDTNGSKYNFYAYTSGGGSALGYILQIAEQKGTGSIQAQSIRIPTPPSTAFVVALEAVGQQYAYTVYTPNCNATVFQSAFAQPTSPTYLNLTMNNSATIYNKGQAVGMCKITSTTNTIYNILCSANDVTGNTYEYKLYIWNSTSAAGTTLLVYNVTGIGSQFSNTLTLPINQTYLYNIYAYAYNGTAVLIASQHLTLRKASLAAPLLGFIAFIVMLVLMLGGASTGNATIFMALTDLGMVVVSIIGIQVPLAVAIIFIIVSGIAVYWDRSHKTR